MGTTKKQIAIIGYGYLGKAYHKVFPDAEIYDPYYEIEDTTAPYIGTMPPTPTAFLKPYTNKSAVNQCDLAIVCVPTDPLPDGSLDMSIIDDVISWLDTPLILIKSALMPGTVDRLVKETGKKIAVSVELIGQGNYYVDPHSYPDPLDPQKHKTLIIGGELDTATACAEYLWDKMQPDIRINLVSALEAEITKLVENAYPALKVTFINTLYNLTQKAGANFIQVHQAWTSDSRVDGFHQRTVSFKRGWKSHCWDKDLPALKHYAEDIGARDMQKLIKTVLDLNKEHLSEN